MPSFFSKVNKPPPPSNELEINKPPGGLKRGFPVKSFTKDEPSKSALS